MQTQIEKNSKNIQCGGCSHEDNVAEAIRIVMAANETQLAQIMRILDEADYCEAC